MPQCEICGESLADDQIVLGQHLWEQHRITPNDYRLRYLGLAPKCKRPGCDNPVPRSADGEWFKCCSPFCALEMGEDIPLGASNQAADGGALSPSQTQQADKNYERAEVIMSGRVCGPLLLAPLAYSLVTGAEIEWDFWHVAWLLAGLAIIVWAYSTRLPKK